ncbi:MAG: peptidase S16 [Alphaproteobacteria bacterium]|nr:peptidase S16 [Alphaproteobacteria bacterium]
MRMNKPYTSISELPEILPVFPLPGVLLLPRAQLPLNIFETRYLAMIDDALASHRLIGMIQPAPAASPDTLASVGTMGRITQIAETGDGRYVLTLSGVCRFRIVEEITAPTLYRQCRINCAEFGIDLGNGTDENSVDRNAIVESLRRYSQVNQLKIDWSEVEKTPCEALISAMSMMAPFGPAEKQALLEAVSLQARADMLIAITEIAINKSGGETTRLQ